MAIYSYRDSTLATNTTHQARLLIGDTDVADGGVNAYFSDAEIAYYISDQGGNVYLAGAELLDILAAKYAGVANVSSGGQSVSGDSISQKFADRAKELRRRGASNAIGTLTVRKTDGFNTSDNIENELSWWKLRDPDWPV